MSNRNDFTNNDTKFTGVGGITIPAGSTAQRPGAPSTATFRYNSDSGSLEFYDGANWVLTDTVVINGGYVVYQGASKLRLTPTGGAEYEFI